MFRQPTIKDVARVAGVHFTTVSMALRQHPAISSRTREHVAAIATQLGYRRNEVFAALTERRQSRRRPVAAPVLLYLGHTISRDDFLPMPHHRSFVAGARRKAEDFGYRLEVRRVGAPGWRAGSLRAVLAAHSARGVILGAWDPRLPAPVVDWSPYRVVKIDSRHVAADVPFVSNDQLDGVLTAMRELQARGYRRIGLALGEHDDEATDGLHLSGLYLAQSAHAPADRVPPYYFPAYAALPACLPAFAAWIRAYRIDAVVSNWAYIQSIVRHAGFAVPREIGCACLCRGERQHRVAGIVPNLESVGANAVTLLTTALREEHAIPRAASVTTYVQGTWHDGPSIRSRR